MTFRQKGNYYIPQYTEMFSNTRLIGSTSEKCTAWHDVVHFSGRPVSGNWCCNQSTNIFLVIKTDDIITRMPRTLPEAFLYRRRTIFSGSCVYHDAWCNTDLSLRNTNTAQTKHTSLDYVIFYTLHGYHAINRTRYDWSNRTHLAAVIGC